MLVVSQHYSNINVHAFRYKDHFIINLGSRRPHSRYTTEYSTFSYGLSFLCYIVISSGYVSCLDYSLDVVCSLRKILMIGHGSLPSIS